jgi:type II secretory pathway predicted ATPase ExeA/cell division septation protein DedD
VYPPNRSHQLSPIQPQVNDQTFIYESYYGLREKPFSLASDPRFLYKSVSHALAFNELLTGIRRREGLIVLTGDIGTGKTTLCRAVLEHLDQKTFSTFVPDPFASREDLLKMLLIDFGVMSVDDLKAGRLRHASRPDLSYPLYEFLKSLQPLRAFAVLIIDEAQNLSVPLLEEVRILSDLEDGGKLLQVVLVGQLELRASLKLPQMRQVDQRVSVRCDLGPLTRDGLSGYVAHRLHVAGGSPDRIQFADAALDEVYVVSRGVPRLVNLICDRALQHGHRERAAQIQPRLIARATEDLGLVARGGQDAVVIPTVSIVEPIDESVAFDEPVVQTAPVAPPAPVVPPMPVVPPTPRRVDLFVKPARLEDEDFDLETMIEPQSAELEDPELFEPEPFEEEPPEPEFTTSPPPPPHYHYQAPAPANYGGPERRRLLAAYASRVEPELYAPRAQEANEHDSEEEQLDEFYDTSAAEMQAEPPAREGLQRHLRIAAGVLVTVALLGWIGQMAFGVTSGTDEADAAMALPDVGDVSLTNPQGLQLVPAPAALVGGDAPVGSTPDPAAPAAPTTSPTPIAPTGAQWYVVQVASFTQPERAGALVAELIGQGLPAYRVTLKVEGGPLHVVLLGRYNAASEAESAAARVRLMPGYADAKIQALAPRQPAQN